MATVYLARDRKHDRAVAIKVLRPELTAALGAERFQREITIVAGLTHPHILPLHDSGEAAGSLYYVMPYIAGESLRDRLSREQQLPTRDAVRIACQVADALGYAHSRSVVHRDIKPENILLSAGHALVTDFGIARAANRVASDRLTQTGLIVGTPAYMSPEQASGDLELDGRSDLYSLGCVLYEMLAGEPPFAGASTMAVITQHLTEPARPLRSLRNDVPEAVEAAVQQALAKRPADRFENASAMAEQLATFGLEEPRRAALRETPSGVSPRGSVTNLPAPPTPLVGREPEVQAVKDLIGKESVRLVTLTGPGGVGKTRLALAVAGDLTGSFADGVSFVPLTESRDERQLVSKIAQTLGVRDSSTTSLLESVKQYLRKNSMLLLLDNFEQLIASAPLVTELLRCSPDLKICVTSREALRLSGEHEFPVRVLPFPDPERSVRPEELGAYGAVRLFVERAHAVNPGFALSAQNGRAVAEICARLDGLPLAIELAAARIKLFSPQALLARLQSRLALLAGGARDLPARQQTMRDAIAWSYHLLSTDEQALFRRLAVFAGGSTIPAAEAVCQPARNALEGLTSLVDKSLLSSEEQLDGEPRFQMLQTIREFGQEALGATGEAETLRERHADFFLTLALQIGPHLSDPSPETWLDRLEAEHDNLRAALEWLTARRQAEPGLRLAVSLWRFWDMRSYFREGRERLEQLLALPESRAATALRLKGLYAAGVLAETQGDYASGRRCFEEHLQINRAMGDTWGIANTLNNLGILALRQSDHAAASGLFEESFALWRELDNRPAMALSLSNLGNVAHAQGDHAGARALHEQSIALFKELRDQQGVALGLGHLGDVARAQDDPAAARALYRESLGLFQKLGNKWGAANVLTELGEVALDQEDTLFAHQVFEESLVLFGDLGDRRGLVRSLEGYAELAAHDGQAERAFRLAGAADALRQALGAPPAPADQARLEQRLRSARQKLGERASSELWREGRAMTIEQALGYATGAKAG